MRIRKGYYHVMPLPTLEAQLLSCNLVSQSQCRFPFSLTCPPPPAHCDRPTISVLLIWLGDPVIPSAVLPLRWRPHARGATQGQSEHAGVCTGASHAGHRGQELCCPLSSSQALEVQALGSWGRAQRPPALVSGTLGVRPARSTPSLLPPSLPCSFAGSRGFQRRQQMEASAFLVAVLSWACPKQLQQGKGVSGSGPSEQRVLPSAAAGATSCTGDIF